METAFIVIVAILPILLVGYAFYWGFVRPALTAKLSLSITLIESEAVELLMHASRPDRTSPLGIVLSRCKRAKRHMHQLTLSRVLLTEIPKEVESEFSSERLVLLGAAEDIKKLDAALNYRLFVVLLVNSPLFAILGIGLSSMADIFSTARNMYMRVTDKTWETAGTGMGRMAACA